MGEKIADAAINERNGLAMFSMGVVLINVGLIMGFLCSNLIGYVGGGLGVVLGTISTMFGFYLAVHYARQYNELLKEAS